MEPLTPKGIAQYAEAHTSAPSELYDRLREETYRDTDTPQMQVGHIEGRLLKLLVQLSGAQRAVEVGTFTGYSALAIAEGLPEDGRLITCDVNPTTAAVAQRYFDMAPWGKRIELRLGDARETLDRLEGSFDFAFIDADKPGYVHYWDAIVPKLRPGGLIVVDNVLWSGRVLDPQSENDHAVVAFNRHAHADGRVEQVMLTVRDGITIARRK